MIARLETMFFFDREHHSFEKLSRMAFMVLHKLAILAQHVRHTHTHTHTHVVVMLGVLSLRHFIQRLIYV